MANPFYIYIHGQWAEIDLETGQVCGSQKTKFMYVKNGKLVIAKTRHVLASLRAVAAGQRAAVRLGATLPARRRRSFKRERRRRLYEPCMKSHCCNAGHHGCSQQQQPIIVTQQVLTNTIGNEPTQFNEQVINKRVLNEQNLNKNILNDNCSNKVLNNVSSNKVLNKISSNKVLNKVSSNKKEQVDQKAVAEKDLHTLDSKPMKAGTSVIKEIMIDYSDVEDIKRFCINNAEYCKKIKLDLFEDDMDYRQSFLYKFHPLVRIEKSKQIEKLIVDDQDMSLKEFAATLGLTHVDDKQKDKHTYKTRQNIEKKNRYNFLDQRYEEKENYTDFMNRKKQKTVISDTDSSDANPLAQKRKNRDEDLDKNKSSKSVSKRNEKERKRLKPAKPIQTKMTAAREYSSLEDHAITAWVSVGDRSRKVNGNKLWRDLQSQYHKITFVSRSWHSLRNRYLRYILPSLGSLMLEPQQQAKLRADAARGEIKLSRKKSLNRRNSIFESKKVVGAFTRLPKVAADQKKEDHNKKVADQTKTVADQTKKVPDQTKKAADQTNKVADQTKKVTDQTKKTRHNTKTVSEEQAKKSLENQVRINIERLLSKPVVAKKGADEEKETPVSKSPSRRAALSLRRATPADRATPASAPAARTTPVSAPAAKTTPAARATPAARDTPASAQAARATPAAKPRLSEDQLMAKEYMDAAPGISTRRRSPPSEAVTKEFVRTRRSRPPADMNSTTSPQPKATEEPETKKRRLYNPRAVWSPATNTVEIVHTP